MTEATVDCWELPIHKDDRFLLCTDGLTNEVSASEIRHTLEVVDNPQEAAEQLVRANANGGNDNITVVDCRCERRRGLHYTFDYFSYISIDTRPKLTRFFFSYLTQPWKQT